MSSTFTRPSAPPLSGLVQGSGSGFELREREACLLEVFRRGDRLRVRITELALPAREDDLVDCDGLGRRSLPVQDARKIPKGAIASAT